MSHALTPAIYDELCSIAMKQYLEHGKHLVIMFHFGPKGLGIMPISGLIDEMKYDQIRIYLMMMKVDSYVFIHEAHVQSANPLRMPKMTPREDPMSTDALCALGVFPDGSKKMRMWDVDRGKILGERRCADGDEVGGRFASFLEV